MKILIVANCQGWSIEGILQLTCLHNVTYIRSEGKDLSALSKSYVKSFDAIIAQRLSEPLWEAIKHHPKVIEFPILLFFGFHPDQTTVTATGAQPAMPWHNMSRIMACAWSRGLSKADTLGLFNPEFIDAMGYVGSFKSSRTIFIDYLSRFTRDPDHHFQKWFDTGLFYFAAHHPRNHVIEDILREVCIGTDIMLDKSLSDLFADPLIDFAINPAMNHPRADNLLTRPDHYYKMIKTVIPAERMIGLLFQQLDGAKDSLTVRANDLKRFDAAFGAWSGRVPEPMVNPYSGSSARALWSRTVAKPAVADVTAGDGLQPVITRMSRVATAGSCFAQHVARAMVSDGLNYYVVETPPEGMDSETAQARGFGLFSARFGNIYSTRQLRQLIQRAYGRLKPIETAWAVEGGFVDPFRPNIGETFPTISAVEKARETHLAQVRKMFETLDVFVFTLGLTEGWLDRRDGAAFPVTPGSVTKAADPAHFEFLNLDYEAVKEDLIAFLGDLRAVNPKAQVILTVSPVPLIATYGAEDVLTATTYSKSVLRAAAGYIAAHFNAVQYFPSYEIITSAFSRGSYFHDDLRSVRPEGVAHVMRVFSQRLVHGGQSHAALLGDDPTVVAQYNQQILDDIASQKHVVCDEELQVRGF